MPRQYLTHSLEYLDALECLDHLLLRQFLLLNIVLYGMEYPFDQCESAILAMSSPSFLTSWSYLLGREREKKKKKKRYYESSAQQQLKQWCAVYILFVKNPRYCRYCMKWAAVRKVESIPARLSTVVQWISNFMYYTNNMKISHP